MRPLLATLVVCLGAAATIGAQNPPDVAGTWTFVSGTSLSLVDEKPVKTEIATPPGPLGSSGTITKDESSFVVAPAAPGSAKTTCGVGHPLGIGQTQLGQGTCHAASSRGSLLLLQIQRVNDKFAISTTRFGLDANGRLILQITGPIVPGDLSTLSVVNLVYRRATPANR